MIVAQMLTEKETGDPSQVGVLVGNQIRLVPA